MPKTTHPLHFEDLSWSDFERLIFALVSKTKDWQRIDWYGQKGGDSGKDIWGEAGGDYYCFQCANHRKLLISKVKADIEKILKAGQQPTYFILVCGGQISARTRIKIYEYAQSVGIQNTDIWDGPKIEEKLRSFAPELIKRFFWDESFPEIIQGEITRSVSILDQIATQSTEVIALLKSIVPEEKKTSVVISRSTFRTELLIELATVNSLGSSNPFKDIIATILLVERFIYNSKTVDQNQLSNKVSLVFTEYFACHSIDRSFIAKSMGHLIHLIFDSNIIETKVPLILSLQSPSDDFKFKYSNKILEFILFELILNAKRYRGEHFDQYSLNKVYVDSKIENEFLKISIKNTCSEVDQKTIQILNSSDDTLTKGKTTGIYLIKMIFKLYNLGQINFFTEKTDGNLSWFVAELTLFPWRE